jgi:hypothetical protein
MDLGIRRGFTAAEKTELWDRWQRGDSIVGLICIGAGDSIPLTSETRWPRHTGDASTASLE